MAANKLFSTQKAIYDKQKLLAEDQPNFNFIKVTQKLKTENQGIKKPVLDLNQNGLVSNG